MILPLIPREFLLCERNTWFHWPPIVECYWECKNVLNLCLEVRHVTRRVFQRMKLCKLLHACANDQHEHVHSNKHIHNMQKQADGKDRKHVTYCQILDL